MSEVKEKFVKVIKIDLPEIEGESEEDFKKRVQDLEAKVANDILSQLDGYKLEE